MVFIIKDSIEIPVVSSLAYNRKILLVSWQVTISFEAVNNTLNFVQRIFIQVAVPSRGSICEPRYIAYSISSRDSST